LEILHTEDDLLEANARKLKAHCLEDLWVASTSGTIRPKGLLRSVLIEAALMLRTDIQELEGLNSVIKAAMHRAQNTNISLELLCSRVCIRKTIAKMTGNATKFKEVIPWASGMARSCFLYWDSRAEILGDLNRWSVTADESVPSGSCKLWNPALLPPRSVRQTVSYNKQVITAIKNFKPTSLDGVPALVLRKPQPLPHLQGEELFTYEVFVLGEKSRSIGMLVKLQPHAPVENVEAHVSDDTSPLEAIQNYCKHVAFQYDNRSSPTQSNNVIAAAFECVTKNQLCTICIVEVIQSSFGSLFAWSTPDIPNVAEVCVLRPPRRKKRSTKPKAKKLLDKENVCPNLPVDDVLRGFDNHVLELDDDDDLGDECPDSDHSDSSQDSVLHRSLDDNDGADSDCEVFGDEWDLAMGLDNADGRESNNDIDSSGEVDIYWKPKKLVIGLQL